jgi:LacI family transcriptional regulator
MLLETDETIQEISLRTGFEYPEYMTVVFKRFTGMSPSDFRSVNIRDA